VAAGRLRERERNTLASKTVAGLAVVRSVHGAERHALDADNGGKVVEGIRRRGRVLDAEVPAKNETG
jgi:hypothetical protein